MRNEFKFTPFLPRNLIGPSGFAELDRRVTIDFEPVGVAAHVMRPPAMHEIKLQQMRGWDTATFKLVDLREVDLSPPHSTEAVNSNFDPHESCGWAK